MGQRSEALAELGCATVGVAVTPIYAQQAFARSLGLSFPLLSDWDGETCSAYGVRYDEWKGHAGLAKRSIFVIDRDRVIRYRWSTDDAAVQPDFDAVVAAVGELAR